MQIQHLSIKNFRGIKELDWFLNSKTVCLIGPGDSTKTTILDAIECATYPSYFLQLNDSDFHNCHIDCPIEIMISLSDVAEEFYQETKFGMYFRGLKDNKIYDEPQDDHLQILTIKFTYTKELEPEWEVYVERQIDKKEINSKSREKLCVFRVGNHVDKNFTWIRGSILNQWSGNMEASKEILNAATRALKESFDHSKVDGLENIMNEISASAKIYGVNQNGDYSANIDTKSIAVGTSAISLHSNGVPLRQMGFGSKRLLTLALQIENCGEGSIILTDEIESGLESYRLRGLIRTLKTRMREKGQIITTTHSPIALVEFDAEDLTVVRAKDGLVECLPVPSNLQKVIRRVPEGLLSKNIIVCEGQTEIGFLTAFEQYKQSQNFVGFSYLGTSVVDGHGSSFVDVALGLSNLKYHTCIFVDSDDDGINAKIPTLKQAGISVFTWSGKKSIEQQITEVLPESLLYSFMQLAVQVELDEGKEDSEGRVINQINSKLNTKYKTIDEIKSVSIYSDQFKTQIGECAKTKSGWFKSISKGKKLGEFIFENTTALTGTELMSVMDQLSLWLYGK